MTDLQDKTGRLEVRWKNHRCAIASNSQHLFSRKSFRPPLLLLPRFLSRRRNRCCKCIAARRNRNFCKLADWLLCNAAAEHSVFVFVSVPAFKSKRGKQQHHPAISNASSLQSNWLKNTTRSNRISFFFQPPDNATADPALPLYGSNFCSPAHAERAWRRNRSSSSNSRATAEFPRHETPSSELIDNTCLPLIADQTCGRGVFLPQQ